MPESTPPRFRIYVSPLGGDTGESSERIGTNSVGIAKRVKSRTGCEQCKRRKVKCDEGKPSCAKCMSREETCTGNFRSEAWQIERPWVSNDVLAHTLSLENETLRHWYDEACLTMAMFRPPVNPLSHNLSLLVRRSRALRHTLECVASAHRQRFNPASLANALQERNSAIVSLRYEVSRVQEGTNRPILLRSMILSSLLLCVSSAWLDPSGTDSGIEFLLGVRGLLPLLCQSQPEDEFAFYVLGLYLYCEAFWSYLIPASKHLPPYLPILLKMNWPPFRQAVHPVTGIATTLCPVIAEIGQYYRRIVETQCLSPTYELDLTMRLRAWKPPVGTPHQPQLLELALRYQDMGTIMLLQARGVVTELSSLDLMMLFEATMRVMETLKHVPDLDPLLNWVGPLLIIAGSEISASYPAIREVAKLSALRLVNWIRVPTYIRSLELVERVWQLRDNGINISWLEVMLSEGLALVAG